MDRASWYHMGTYRSAGEVISFARLFSYLLGMSTRAILLISVPSALALAGQEPRAFQSDTQYENFYGQEYVLKKPKFLLAQYDGDDSYDPFADYSEFEEATQEEADIHFFKNGRFFNIGFMLGYRAWTDVLAQIAQPNFSWGLYLAYFFDLNFALQVGYTSSTHIMEIPGGSFNGNNFNTFNATMGFSSLSVALKYYFNVQNITRGLADLNPYVIGGFTVNYQNYIVTGENITIQNDGPGFQAGLGIEIPISRNKMYLGAQFVYHVVNFPNEGAIIQSDGDLTGVSPRGDAWNGFFIIGVNF